MPDRRRLLALAGLTLLAAALRFPTLDAQSYWNDEAVTALLLDQPLGDALGDVPESESTPPLYYVLAWLWTQAFGVGEVGLRSLSALLGTATVPALALVAWRLAGWRAALAAGALAATSPLLAWYSQEARAYALLVLLATLALLALVRAAPPPGVAPSARPRAALAAWGVASALALATHYFAAFAVAPMAVWLLWRARGARRRGRAALAAAVPVAVPPPAAPTEPAERGPDPRAALAAVGAVAAAGLALLPLALAQRSNEGAAFIERSSLAVRAAQVPKQFLVGFDAPAELALALVAAALAAYGAWLALARTGPAARRGAALAAGLGAAAVALPLALALAGVDYLLTRNAIAAWPALAAALAAGYGARRAGWRGPAAAAALAAVSVAVVVAVAADPRYGRDDWRGAAEALGPAERARVVVVTPPDGRVPLTYYLPGARPIPQSGATAAEIDVIGLAKREPGERAAPPRGHPPPPAAGFELVERIEQPSFTLLRWRAPEAIGLTREGVAAGRLADADAAVLVQPERR